MDTQDRSPINRNTHQFSSIDQSLVLIVALIKQDGRRVVDRRRFILVQKSNKNTHAKLTEIFVLMVQIRILSSSHHYRLLEASLLLASWYRRLIEVFWRRQAGLAWGQGILYLLVKALHFTLWRLVGKILWTGNLKGVRKTAERKKDRRKRGGNLKTRNFLSSLTSTPYLQAANKRWRWTDEKTENYHAVECWGRINGRKYARMFGSSGEERANLWRNRRWNTTGG